jgi:hypothetical protein
MDTDRPLPRSTRPRPTRFGVLVTVAASALIGCGPAEDRGAGDHDPASPDEVTTTASAPCLLNGWQTIDAGDFSFRLPPGVEDQQVQGIDSLVGQYDGAGMNVSFDYGGFTNDFGDLADTGSTEELTVDGYPARIITSDAADTAGYGSPHLTALYVSVPDGSAPTGRALGLSVAFEDAALVPVAHCIVRSVAFP